VGKNMFKSSFIVLILLALSYVTAQRPAQSSNDVLLGEWEAKLFRMESLFQEQIQQLVAQNDQLKAEVEQLELHRTARQAESQHLKQQLERLTSSATNAIGSRAAPRNCLSLTQIGHRLSGLYLVQSATNQIQTVYCDIDQVTGVVNSETIVGYNDVKSTPVYFYVQRDSTFSNTGSIIPYTIAKVNIGNAFNIVTGVFTVPRNGRYMFTLSGISQPRLGSTRVYLYVSGVDTGSSFAVDQFDTFALQAILDLKEGNLVTTYLGEGSVGDNGNANMHFTGFLLEEDLPAV